ncbi:MAG: hypothetical protein IJM53_04865, partial [Lachnospiraceae bacterium]|nr:hypothetical protein [Lachnospiraceae bacterium]
RQRQGLLITKGNTMKRIAIILAALLMLFTCACTVVTYISSTAATICDTKVKTFSAILQPIFFIINTHLKDKTMP